MDFAASNADKVESLDGCRFCAGNIRKDTAVVEWIMADTSLQIFILYWILYVWAPEVAAS